MTLPDADNYFAGERVIVYEDTQDVLSCAEFFPHGKSIGDLLDKSRKRFAHLGTLSALATLEYLFRVAPAIQDSLLSWEDPTGKAYEFLRRTGNADLLTSVRLMPTRTVYQNFRAYNVQARPDLVQVRS